MTIIFGIFILYGVWIVYGFSSLATVIHGGQELDGWYGKPPFWIFAFVQVSFLALAATGLLWDQSWAVWLLIVCRLFDGIGFHIVWHPEWPGRETLLLPLADAVFLTLWMIA